MLLDPAEEPTIGLRASQVAALKPVVGPLSWGLSCCYISCVTVFVCVVDSGHPELPRSSAQASPGGGRPLPLEVPHR